MGIIKNKTNYLFLSLFLVYIFLYRMLIIPKFLKYSESITSVFLIFMFILSIMFYGFKKTTNTNFKKNVLRKVLKITGIYFLLIYFIGLFTGYLSNAYSLNPISIFNNIFFQIIIIVMIELIRSNFINYNKGDKRIIALLVILLTIFEIILNFKMEYISNTEAIFKFITSKILPIAFKNYMCSYLTYYTDFETSLVYSLITGLYKYLVPIEPNLDNLLISLINILIPFIIVMSVSKYRFNYDETRENIVSKKYVRKSDIPLIILLGILVLLVFGVGPYKVVGIRSGSMSPAINVGDAVLLEQNVSKEDLKENDIVAYTNKNNETVVHRIIAINKDGTYITKGDHNNTADKDYVSIDQITGKVKFRIPYIAYPAVYFDRR